VNIEKAIDRNVELKGELTREGRLEKAEAVQLGIEALKRTKENRSGWGWFDRVALKGEE